MESTISVEELAQAFKESLDRGGKLHNIRASLRSEVFQCLQNSIKIKKQVDDKSRDDIQLYAPEEVELCHGLIIEYLRYNGLVHTLSTFEAETEGMHTRISYDYDAVDESSIVKRLKKKLNLNNLNDDMDENKSDRCSDEANNATDELSHNNSKIPILLQIIDSLRQGTLTYRR
jgi:hypothetical protein